MEKDDAADEAGETTAPAASLRPTMGHLLCAAVVGTIAFFIARHFLVTIEAVGVGIGAAVFTLAPSVLLGLEHYDPPL